MAKVRTSRKQRFRAALAIAGLTAEGWAVKEGITPQWLSMVLNKKAKSLSLDGRIDAFADEQLGAYRALAS